MDGTRKDTTGEDDKIICQLYSQFGEGCHETIRGEDIQGQ